MRFAIALAAACLLATAAWGDSLQLKNGSLIKGKYLGGSENEISFQVGSTVQRYAVGDVVSLSFDSLERASSSSQDLQLSPRPLRPSTATSSISRVNARTVTVPTGTRITIRTIDAVDSDTNKIGDRFQASLEEAVVVGDVTVVPKGATVYGRLSEVKEAGQLQGRSELKLELTGILVNGQTVPLVTGDYSLSGSSRGISTAKRVGGGAALGAIIGGIAGGGKGAAIGAGVGAGAGTAVQIMTKGEQVHVPSETLLDFTLQQDVRIPVSE